MAGVPSPTESIFMKSTVLGLQRKLAKPVVKKLPVTVAILEAIVDNAERSGSLADFCLATACVIGYAARTSKLKRALCLFRSPRARPTSSVREMR